MQELITQQKQLPDNLEDLTKFALIGREKLNAVKAEIRAIDKVGLAKEVLEQKREEAQEIAELVTLSEMRIGRMLKEIPKATTNHKNLENVPQDKILTPKSAVVRELGFTPKQTAQFQQMADHEPQVREAIAEARERNDIVSRTAVMKKIDEAKKPHVANNSTDDEWYTPKQYIESAREVMGSIDLDPASNDFANETVQADTYFTEKTDGLNQKWFGNVWLNPPYSTSLLGKFAEKVSEQEFDQAVILVNNATETGWFETLISGATAIVFHKGRIKYVKRDGEHGSPLQGQAFIYHGNNPKRFLDVFAKYGWGALL